MSLERIGQRCVSEREPELGLGRVTAVEPAAKRIAIEFPATGEKRLYALGTPVLRRVIFPVGERVTSRDGRSFAVEALAEEAGLVVYEGSGYRLREDELSDVTSVSSPPARFLAGQVDPAEVFDLRRRALEERTRLRQSEVRGFLGGRVDLIPHQFYILHEVTSRHLPRVLLADEVGLGKTIEACLILQRLRAVGQVQRALVLVPETLVHQWFVELLRRFNLWFSILDEARCEALATSDPGLNPFLSTQLALCSVRFLAHLDSRREEALAAGWDLVIVDEAHHLEWTPEQASPEYQMVAQLAERTPGLLLLTATPTQLGLAGHFARLRLLDPERFSDLASFQAETERFGAVAQIAEKLLERRPLAAADQEQLGELFTRDPAGLARRWDAVQQGRPGAREALLRTLLDQHGTGRVVFRNTRAAMPGFPRRKYCPVPLEAPDLPALRVRSARELHAEETGQEQTVRYSFREDPRLDWLADFLREDKDRKVLLICKSTRKVAAIAAALQDRLQARVAQFHEGLPLVQRDRNAAWFAEPDGAQLLLCSEIGSEGRNFQFAHHLVLFDLPLNPALLEQRIGRLDRIGQTEAIRLHVPFIAGSADAWLAEWYHEGLDAFAAPLHGGSEFQAAFRERVLALAVPEANATVRAARAELIGETRVFRETLLDRLHRGRDRLLELNSFDAGLAGQVIARVREAENYAGWRELLFALLDHFGVRVKEHEEGDVFLDPSHAYVEGFPSLPAEGMLATLDRRRALAREDIRFVTPDHPLVEDAIELLLESPAGTTALVRVEADEPGLLLEAIFLLETVAETRWHVDQFLPPTPVRVVVDARGGERTPDKILGAGPDEPEDLEVARFLEQPGFHASMLEEWLEHATDVAERKSGTLRAAAQARAESVLGAAVERLEDLRRVNPLVKEEEIALARERRTRSLAAIAQARLRLDCLRVIVAG